MKSSEDVGEKDSLEPDGPDTSSFTAFLASFWSSSESSNPSKEAAGNKAEKEDIDSGSEIMENEGRKGLLSRGKQSVGRALHKAARLGGYRGNRQRSEAKGDVGMTNGSNGVALELQPMKFSDEKGKQIELPNISEPSLLLSESMRSALYVSLPVMAKGKNWVLLYSTWRHGISLATLYRRSTLCPGHFLLVVGDKKGAVFGGLVESPLRPTNMRKYQGTNSSFVFTYLTNQLVIFQSTGANRYFTLCSPDHLAMGGGGHFALYLDGELLNGSSAASETFGNSCLSHTENFEVKEVELWGFVYASKYDEVVALSRTEKPGICRW